MGNFGWSELLVIGIVALIVVGPKDLPVMFHTLGRFSAKIRSLGREFNRAMDDAVRDSGVGDVANDIRKATSPKSLGLGKMQEAAKKFESWDPLKPAEKTSKPVADPNAPHGPATEALAAEQEEKRRKLAEEAAAKAEARKAEAAAVAALGKPKPAAAAPTELAEALPKPKRKPAAKKPAEPKAAKANGAAQPKAEPKAKATAAPEDKPKPKAAPKRAAKPRATPPSEPKT